MTRRWQCVALGVLLVVLVVPTAAGGWASEPFPPVDAENLVGPDAVVEQTATVQVRPDGDGIVTLTAHTTGPVEDDLDHRLSRALDWRYGEEIAREASVTVERDRIELRYRVPDVAVAGPGETLIVDALYSTQRPPMEQTVDRLTIEGPNGDQTVGGSDRAAIVLTGDEAAEPRIEPRLVAFAPAGPHGTLAGHVGLFQYRAIASLGLYAGLATWPLLLLGCAIAFVWTGPRIDQSPRSVERFEAGYVALAVLGLFGVGIALSNPDLPSLLVTPLAVPVTVAIALAPLVLVGAWSLIGSERGPQIDPDRLVRWAAALGVGVIVTAPLVAGIESPLTGPYRLVVALVPVVGAIPVVVARGRYRAMVAIGLLGVPIALAFAASPAMHGPDYGAVYNLYALVVGVCLLGAAQIDRRRLLDWQSPDPGPSTADSEDASTPGT